MRNTLISIFDGIKDPRKIDRCLYELGDLLAVAFLTYLSGQEDYSDMALYASSRSRESVIPMILSDSIIGYGMTSTPVTPDAN